MNEIHRYQVVKMLSDQGNKIAYDPHGPWIVMASDFDRVTAELEAALGREAALREELCDRAGTIGRLTGERDAAKETLERWHELNLQRETKVEELQQRLAAADGLEAQLSKLAVIGSLIRSQDNRCTDQPIFAVMEKRSIPTLETHDHDRIDWVETESGDYCLADETKARRLEALHRGHRETPGWERYAMKDMDVFVTACFTEQGCKDFLARDGHNHRSPFIYAFGSYRNGEYQAVREFLKSLPDIGKP